jgi:hypothetical protein
VIKLDFWPSVIQFRIIISSFFAFSRFFLVALCLATIFSTFVLICLNKMNMFTIGTVFAMFKLVKIGTIVAILILVKISTIFIRWLQYKQCLQEVYNRSQNKQFSLLLIKYEQCLSLTVMIFRVLRMQCSVLQIKNKTFETLLKLFHTRNLFIILVGEVTIE